MKKIKLLIVWIFTCMLWWSYSFWAYLSLSPYEWEVGMWCIEAFTVWLDMEEWESSFAMQLDMDSNMEFVNFENWDIFEYSLPPVLDQSWIVRISLIDSSEWKTSKWGPVWTFYYKVIVDDVSYINFYFTEKKSTIHTTLFSDGHNLIDWVKWWKYTISYDKSCDNYNIITWNNNQTIDDILQDLREKWVEWQSFSQYNTLELLSKYWLYFVSLFVVILVLWILLVCKSKKHNEKK